MMCSMCESHMNDVIRNNFKIKSVSSSAKGGCCEIVSEERLDEGKLSEAVANTGYKLLGITAEEYEKKKRGFLWFARKQQSTRARVDALGLRWEREMLMLELMKSRRSTKKYKSEMPRLSDIDKIIEAGLYAPSGRNRQGAIIVAVTDKTVRDRLSAANAAVLGANTDPFYGAPCVLVVLADKSVNTSIYDGSLVMENLMLASHALGLGSCWIHRAKEVFEQPEWQEWLKSIGVEGEYEGVGNCIVGYPVEAEFPAPLPRKEGRVFKV